MPKGHKLLSNFSKGELSPRIEGRPDLVAYFEGGREMTNVLLLRQGGLDRRPGMRYVAAVKIAQRDTILIPFEFSVDDAFMLEFGHLYIRIFRADGTPVLLLGVPLEVVSPYTEAQLRAIDAKQSADVLYLWHPDVPQQKLLRVSDTNWQLLPVNFNPPAYFDADAALNSPMAYGAPTFPTDSIVTRDDVFLTADAGRLLVAGPGRAQITTVVNAHQLIVDVLDSFDPTKITVGPGVLSSVGLSISTTQPHGLLVGDVIRIVGGAQDNEMRWIDNIPTSTTATIQASQGGFSVDQNGVDWQKHVPILIGSWGLRTAPQTSLDPDKKGPVGAQINLLTASGGTVAAFRSDDVDKFIEIYGGVVRITQLINAANIKGEILSALKDATTVNPPAADAGTWTLKESSWSEARGYPRCGEFYQGRLGQASTKAQPTTFWLSASDDFENYVLGVEADRAIEDTIASRRVNRLEWLADSIDLFIGTAGAEFRTIGERQGEPLGGDKIPVVERLTSYGSAAIQPIVIGRQVLFVDRSRQKILAMSFSITQDSFDAIEITGPSDHITGTGVRLGHVGFQQRLDPRLYYVREDGQLLALTFLPNEKVVGFTRIVTDGTVEAVAVIPSSSGNDRVWVIVKRTINGIVKRYVEYFETNAPEMASRAWKNLQTDCAKVYSGPPTITITGADHLEGKTVDVVADGSYRGTRVVTGGSFTLDDPASVVEYGLHYDSKAVTMRPAIEGQMIEGLPRSWDHVSVRLLNTIGGHVNGEPLEYTPSDLDMLGLFTGDRKIVGQGWDTDGRITIEQRQPYPMTLLAVYGTLNVGDHV